MNTDVLLVPDLVNLHVDANTDRQTEHAVC